MWKINGKRKLRDVLPKIDTLIGKNTQLAGNLHFNGGLQLDGLVRGNISADEGSNAVLVIGENGRVEGEVCVPNVIIHGKVAGPVSASQTIELRVTATVAGDIFYNQIEIMAGAKLSGKMIYMPEKGMKAELMHEKVVKTEDYGVIHYEKESI